MSNHNLSGSKIQDTFQRVVHTDGTILYDGTGKKNNHWQMKHHHCFKQYNTGL